LSAFELQNRFGARSPPIAQQEELPELYNGYNLENAFFDEKSRLTVGP